MLIIGHQALVVIGRESGVCDSRATERCPAACDTVGRGSIKIRLEVTEFTEHNSFRGSEVIAASIELILVESSGAGDLIVRTISWRIWLGQQCQKVFCGRAKPIGTNYVEHTVALDLRSSRSVSITCSGIVDGIDGCDRTEISSPECIDRHCLVA